MSGNAHSYFPDLGSVRWLRLGLENAWYVKVGPCGLPSPGAALRAACSPVQAVKLALQSKLLYEPSVKDAEGRSSFLGALLILELTATGCED